MIKKNIIYGMVILIPVAIIFLVLVEIVGVLGTFGDALGLETVLGTLLGLAVAILLVLALCFLVGAIVRKEIMGLSFERIEDSVLKKVPAYGIINRVLTGFVEDEKDDNSTPVLVDIHGSGSAVFGLVVEENTDGSLTVFVPTAPALTVGAIYVVERDRVRRLAAGVGEVATCIAEWGVGSRQILDKTVP